MNTKNFKKKNEDKYFCVLKQYDPDLGLSKEDIIKMLDKLVDDEKGYVPIDIEGTLNSVASGFITMDSYEELDFDINKIKKTIVPVLDDISLEEEDGKYLLENDDYALMLYNF